MSTERPSVAVCSPGAPAVKATSSVCVLCGSMAMSCPEAEHEKGVPRGIVTRTVAGRMPSLRSTSGCLAERSRSSRGNWSIGTPASLRAAGFSMDTCGSVPSPTRSKSSDLVAATVPCSTCSGGGVRVRVGVRARARGGGRGQGYG